MALVLSMLTIAAAAPAATITYETRAAFAAAAGATTVETFNQYDTNTSFALTPVDVGAFTLSMAPGADSLPDGNMIDASSSDLKNTIDSSTFLIVVLMTRTRFSSRSTHQSRHSRPTSDICH